MKEALLTSGIALEVALLGVIFKLGLTLGTINSTLREMAKDIHEANAGATKALERLDHHERAPHPGRHEPSRRPL